MFAPKVQNMGMVNACLPGTKFELIIITRTGIIMPIVRTIWGSNTDTIAVYARDPETEQEK